GFSLLLWLVEKSLVLPSYWFDCKSASKNGVLLIQSFHTSSDTTCGHATDATQGSKSIWNLDCLVVSNPGKYRERLPDNSVQYVHPQVASSLTFPLSSSQ
ncbi:hypothetical protein Tco_1053343, partial [Tanacetum coccineum]